MIQTFTPQPPAFEHQGRLVSTGRGSCALILGVRRLDPQIVPSKSRLQFGFLCYD